MSWLAVTCCTHFVNGRTITARIGANSSFRSHSEFHASEDGPLVSSMERSRPGSNAYPAGSYFRILDISLPARTPYHCMIPMVIGSPV